MTNILYDTIEYLGGPRYTIYEDRGTIVVRIKSCIFDLDFMLDRRESVKLAHDILKALGDEQA